METDLIYDLGCNNGDDTDFYLRKGFRVLALDADASLCDHVRQRFSRNIADGRLTVIQGLISDCKSETAPFFIFEECRGWSTADPVLKRIHEDSGRTSATIDASVVNIVDVMRQHGVPYYMKIDIEGNDLVALRGLESSDREPNGMPTHVSSELARHDLHSSLDQLMTLQRCGYSRFLLFNHGMRMHVRAPKPAREGQYAEFYPNRITTGPFGRDLDGKWLDFYAATKRIAEICRLYALFRDDPRFSKNGQFSGTLRSKLYNRFRRHVLSDPINGFELHAAK